MKHIVAILACVLLGACNSVPESTVPLRPDVLYYQDGPKAREAAAEVARLYGSEQETAIVSHRLPKMQDPVRRVSTAPEYPLELKKEGATGQVIVDFIVGETGEVLFAAAVASTDPRFNASAVQAVRTWRFDPARRGGQPVRCRLRVPLSFTLTPS